MTREYLVKIPVYEIIEQVVVTDETDEEKILELAKEKALEEQPKVNWLFDENGETEVKKI